MEEYWKNHLHATPTVQPVLDAGGDEVCSALVVTSFDRYRQTLIRKDDKEGWAAEKCHYLKDMPADVTKETDVVEWWQVSKLQNIFAAHFTSLSTGPCSVIPYPGMDHPGCASLPSNICSMLMPVLL